MKCLEERRVKLATFLLHKSVEDWWTLYTTSAEGSEFVMWEGFRKGFKEWFYHHSFFDVKRKEFLSLKQPDMTIVEYERNFMRLTKYAVLYNG